MAKANRVIQKAKPPAVKHVAIIDPDSGVISGYASGTNIVLGDVELQRNWTDVTEIPGGKQLSGNVNRKIVHEGKVKNKPVVKLIIDSKKVKPGHKVKVHFEVEGSEELLPEEIDFKVKGKKEKLKKNSQFEISSDVEETITLKIDDPRVYSPEIVRIKVTKNG